MMSKKHDQILNHSYRILITCGSESRRKGVTKFIIEIYLR